MCVNLLLYRREQEIAAGVGLSILWKIGIETVKLFRIEKSIFLTSQFYRNHIVGNHIVKDVTLINIHKF